MACVTFDPVEAPIGVAEGVSVMQVMQKLHYIAGKAFPHPIVILGYLPIHRSLSFRLQWPAPRDLPAGQAPQVQMAITHLLVMFGPDCPDTTYLQGLGRGTGELRSTILQQTQGARNYVTVLTEKFDLIAARRWESFQSELQDRMLHGWTDDGVQHAPCDLETALQGRFEPFMNFQLSRCGRKGKTVRRHGQRGFEFQLQLLAPDEKVPFAIRSRKLDAGCQLLPVGVTMINEQIPRLEASQDPFDVRQVADLDINTELSNIQVGWGLCLLNCKARACFDPSVVAQENAVMANRMIILHMEDVFMHGQQPMPRDQQSIADAVRSLTWVKKAIQNAVEATHSRPIRLTGDMLPFFHSEQGEVQLF